MVPNSEPGYGTSMHFPYCRDGRCTGCLPPLTVGPFAQCSVGQVGDREWWCSTHNRDAQDCDDAAGRTNLDAFYEGLPAQ